jgi:hypothetical protein
VQPSAQSLLPRVASPARRAFGPRREKGGGSGYRRARGKAEDHADVEGICGPVSFLRINADVEEGPAQPACLLSRLTGRDIGRVLQFDRRPTVHHRVSPEVGNIRRVDSADIGPEAALQERAVEPADVHSFHGGSRLAIVDK